MYSKNKLTKRQSEIFNFLFEFKEKEKMSPTYREIADHFGFKSAKAAADHVRALEKKGLVSRHGRRSRGIEIIAHLEQKSSDTISVPILGEIPAGSPEQKIEHRNRLLTIDASLINGPTHHRFFALKVKGDSMIGRGIHDGDWVIADADVVPCENEIVVALIDGENTLKTLAKKKSQIYLKAENPACEDWVPATELIIQGTARAIIRRV
ncbi:transcriptional repressor LexA [uncultured Desulfosarcina sp.]|uniref:transcriptional repressor LexA n=1 Tax=uncultured Desulfosarcina sp. TaxID=218289 RepID=UPI0029C95576|nr:transcriptional repressor LexA [uncultured Desulfosarcina sp.]